MAGTWESQNKVLPGAYINIRTNEPLSITPGDRGTVVILQEMSVGTDGAMYTITATEAAWPDGATASDKKLAAEALKKAKTVLVYKLKASHKAADVTAALAALKTVQFNTLCYPYEGEGEEVNKTAIATWIKAMRDDEGGEVSGGAREPCGRQRGDHQCCSGHHHARKSGTDGCRGNCMGGRSHSRCQYHYVKHWYGLCGGHRR